LRAYLKKTHHKNRTGGVAQCVGPEFKPQHHKKKILYIAQMNLKDIMLGEIIQAKKDKRYLISLTCGIFKKLNLKQNRQVITRSWG
jgi:hypothetical protein